AGRHPRLHGPYLQGYQASQLRPSVSRRVRDSIEQCPRIHTRHVNHFLSKELKGPCVVPVADSQQEIVFVEIIVNTKSGKMKGRVRSKDIVDPLSPECDPGVCVGKPASQGRVVRVGKIGMQSGANSLPYEGRS